MNSKNKRNCCIAFRPDDVVAIYLYGAEEWELRIYLRGSEPIKITGDLSLVSSLYSKILSKLGVDTD